MAPIQATRAQISPLPRGCWGQLVAESANQVAQRMAAKRISSEQHDIHRQDDGSDANAEAFLARGGIGKPHRLPHIATEKAYKQNCQVQEVAVRVLQDERE